MAKPHIASRYCWKDEHIALCASTITECPPATGEHVELIVAYDPDIDAPASPSCSVWIAAIIGEPS